MIQSATKQIDIISDTELLTKYLIKNYGKDKAKEFLLTYKSNLFGKQGLAFLIGTDNLEFFNMYFLQDVYVGDDNRTRSIHYEIW